MQIEIILKNYRCFPDSKPASITIRKGFIAFVGVNNSGKSSLLKFFYEFRDLFRFISFPNGNLTSVLQGNRQSFGLASSISDVEEIFCNSNNRDLEIQFFFTATDGEPGQDNPLIPHRIDVIVPRSTNQWLAKIYLSDGLLNLGKGGLDFQGTILRLGGVPKAELSYVFQVFKTLLETFYIGPFRNAINIGTNTNYFDIQIGQAFVEVWREWKTGHSTKHNEAIIRLTESIRHIFDYDKLEINPSADNQTLKVFIDEKSYKLSELGSGITQFILVIANAAIRQPSYILIDEPELNLHPSLQLDFLTTLGSYASEGVLFATHSIGLARASADLVYSVRKNNSGESEISELEATPRLSEFLGELIV